MNYPKTKEKASPEEVVQGKIHVHMTGHATVTIPPFKLARLGQRFGVFEARALNDLALGVRQELLKVGFA
ncbi:MAG: hypothetical protein WC827_04415 [Candidatus Paceibacterota bacterium]|jgi:hypothetical protein